MNSPRQPRYNLPLSVRKGVIPLQQRPQVPAQIPVKISRPVLKSARTTPLKAQQKIVGSGLADIKAATELCAQALAKNHYPISNDIGVGILTYNRPASLHRLVNSIFAHTDIQRTTVFISDDYSDDPEQQRLLDILSKRTDLVVLRHTKQLGVAGNSNRLLRCLSRFKYKLLLNDDVKVTAKGWDKFYFEVMQKTGMHHLCHRQPGIYGAQRGEPVNGTVLEVVHEKPQGAVIAFDDVAFRQVGFFDEKFGQYGMEHVDWSTRLFSIQQQGFFDASGSSAFFRLHADESAVQDRVTKLKAARARFETRTDGYIEATNASLVPKITIVVPFRDHGRRAAIETVINNLKAQRYPEIEIILSEEDAIQRWSGSLTYKHVFSKGRPNPDFCKSVAWNAGVSQATSDKLILHDADMLAPADYTATISKLLDQFDSCHICSRVIYATKDSSDKIATGIINTSACERICNYFEGGSLGCRTKTYWGVGGFAECFVGYGMEDCEFYERLSKNSSWFGVRTVDLLHLWHDRTPGWMEVHNRNKQVGADLQRRSMQERIAELKTANKRWM